MKNKEQYNNDFKRKSETKGFHEFKLLDNFIQNSLEKFKLVDPMEELYIATKNDKNSIISHKSTIPDLVIWNKKFNKNYCFIGADLKKENPFPRFQFFLKIKGKKNNDKDKKSKKNINDKNKSNKYINFPKWKILLAKKNQMGKMKN